MKSTKGQSGGKLSLKLLTYWYWRITGIWYGVEAKDRASNR